MTAQRQPSTQDSRWTADEVHALFARPFMDLVLEAQQTLRAHFPANAVQLSTLLSIKTGACPEDCRYCSQSGHYKTAIEKEKLMDADLVLAQAQKAKDAGASRFCMGGAWRSPPAKAMPEIIKMIKGVKALGMESCLTAGLLSNAQAEELKDSGLDYYNHNLDTSPEFYDQVVTTRSYQDRLDTLEVLRQSGIKTCCGGILGLGESQADRISLLLTLANLPEQPESVPLNLLVPIAGTPFADNAAIDAIEFAKTVAVCRLMMPKTMVRLSAGRGSMSNELQALCFLAGANSIHYGDKLLTTPIPGKNQDQCSWRNLASKPCQHIQLNHESI